MEKALDGEASNPHNKVNFNSLALKSNSWMPVEAQRLEHYIFMVMIQMSHPQSASNHCFNDQTGKIGFSGDLCCSLFFRPCTKCCGKAALSATNSHTLQIMAPGCGYQLQQDPCGSSHSFPKTAVWAICTLSLLGARQTPGYNSTATGTLASSSRASCLPNISFLFFLNRL